MNTLVEMAKQAIDAVFGDKSVSPEETKERMEELIDHIQEQIDAL